MTEFRRAASGGRRGSPSSASRPRNKLRFPRFLFVDIGSGAGRVLHAAAMYGFERSAGVEIAPAMCELAGENLRRYVPRRAMPVLVNANIRHLDFDQLVRRFDATEPVAQVVCFMRFTMDSFRIYRRSGAAFGENR